MKNWLVLFLLFSLNGQAAVCGRIIASDSIATTTVISVLYPLGKPVFKRAIDLKGPGPNETTLRLLEVEPSEMQAFIRLSRKWFSQEAVVNISDATPPEKPVPLLEDPTLLDTLELVGIFFEAATLASGPICSLPQRLCKLIFQKSANKLIRELITSPPPDWSGDNLRKITGVISEIGKEEEARDPVFLTAVITESAQRVSDRLTGNHGWILLPSPEATRTESASPSWQRQELPFPDPYGFTQWGWGRGW